MTHRQYFKAVDPAVLCPISGYVDPEKPEQIGPACISHGYIPDPNIYTDMPILSEIPAIGAGQITLVMNDTFDRNIRLMCTVSSAGKYKVQIYGLVGTLVSTTLVNSGAYFDSIIPLGLGYVNTEDSCTTYNIVISPELLANNLTTFRIYTNTGYDTNGPSVIACFINAPALTTLASAFYQIRKIRYIEFLGTNDVLTSLTLAFQYCDSLEKLIIPHNNLPACTNFLSMASYTPKLKIVVLPTALSAAQNLGQMFYYSNAQKVTLPASLPACTSIASIFSYSTTVEIIFSASMPLITTFIPCAFASKLRFLTMPTYMPLVNSISTAFQDCKELEVPIVFPEMPLCTTIASALINCLKVPHIGFTGPMNVLTSILNLAQNCYKLKSLTMPTSINGMNALYNMRDPVTNCYELETITMPTSWVPTVALTSNAANPSNFFSCFPGCYALKTITKILNGPTEKLGDLTANNLLSLEEWDQPELDFVNVTITPKGAAPNVGLLGKLTSLKISNYPLIYTVNVKYNNMSVAGLNAMMASLPKMGQLINLNNVWGYGNPGYAMTQGASGDGLSINKFTYQAQYTPTLYVGMNVQINAVSYQVPVAMSEGVITGSNNRGNVHGHWNGREIAFNYCVGITGINAHQIYYVVNATATTYQVSETLGGAPVAFTGTIASTVGRTSFKTTIQAINGREITVDAIFNSSTFYGATFSDLDLSAAYMKGFLFGMQT